MKPFIPAYRACLICGTPFMPQTSRSNVCSEVCRHQRQLNYGAAYRKNIRDMRAKILERFGGRMPTQDEILALIRNRKDIQ